LVSSSSPLMIAPSIDHLLPPSKAVTTSLASQFVCIPICTTIGTDSTIIPLLTTYRYFIDTIQGGRGRKGGGSLQKLLKVLLLSTVLLKVAGVRIGRYLYFWGRWAGMEPTWTVFLDGTGLYPLAWQSCRLCCVLFWLHESIDSMVAINY
jgi:hypothetical protein